MPPLKPKAHSAMAMLLKSMPLKSTALQRGLTLVELVAVLAIIGVLTSIAVPQYNDYIIKSSIHAAQKILTDQSLLLAEFYSSNNTYIKGCQTLPTIQNSDWVFICLAISTKEYSLMAKGRDRSVFSTDSSNFVSISMSQNGPTGMARGDLIGWGYNSDTKEIPCWPTSKSQKTCQGTGS